MVCVLEEVWNKTLQGCGPPGTEFDTPDVKLQETTSNEKNYWQKTCFPPKKQNKKTVILRWSSPSLGCSRRVSSSASGDGYVSSFPSRFFSVLSLSAAVFTGGLSLLLYSWRSASTSWWPKCVASSIGVLPHLEDINVILFSWFPHLF